FLGLVARNRAIAQAIREHSMPRDSDCATHVAIVLRRRAAAGQRTEESVVVGAGDRAVCRDTPAPGVRRRAHCQKVPPPPQLDLGLRARPRSLTSGSADRSPAAKTSAHPCGEFPRTFCCARSLPTSAAAPLLPRSGDTRMEHFGKTLEPLGEIRQTWLAARSPENKGRSSPPLPTADSGRAPPQHRV